MCVIDSVQTLHAADVGSGAGSVAQVREAAARLINAFVITPLRIAFLVLLIGTTLEVAATQGRGCSASHAGGDT